MAFLATAWEQVQAEQELAEVFPDTFVHPAIREGMGAAPAPGGAAARLGYWCFETMTPLVAGTYPAARAAVDVALTAADLVLDGAPGRVRAVPPARPPRRPGRLRRLLLLQQRGRRRQATSPAPAPRVTVLDVDYHHGNGTQQIFYERDDVQYVSLHGDPNRAYPYFAGYADEHGGGRGAWARRSTCPCPPGTDDATYQAGLARALEAIDAFGPTTLVVSLGVDTYQLDPIADFALTTDGFARAGAMVGGARPTDDRAPGGRLPRARRSARTSAPGWPPSTAPPSA